MTVFTNGHFYYFLRLPGPFGLGHMGWGFRLSVDRWMFGSLENTRGLAVVGKNGDNDYWWALSNSEEQMLFEMRTMEAASRFTGQGRIIGYTHYKKIPVDDPKPRRARSVSLGQRGYSIAFNNCLDNAARIGDAYGVPAWSWSRHFPSHLNVNLAPRGFFFSTLHEHEHHLL